MPDRLGIKPHQLIELLREILADAEAE